MSQDANAGACHSRCGGLCVQRLACVCRRVRWHAVHGTWQARGVCLTQAPSCHELPPGLHMGNIWRGCVWLTVLRTSFLTQRGVGRCGSLLGCWGGCASGLEVPCSGLVPILEPVLTGSICFESSCLSPSYFGACVAHRAIARHLAWGQLQCLLQQQEAWPMFAFASHTLFMACPVDG